MTEERILITVRTYPTLSSKYQETVCTGGISDTGQWRRLYPVQWRLLPEHQQYKKHDIIKVKVGEYSADGRVESRKIDASSIQITGKADIKSTIPWVKSTTFNSMAEMKAKGRTLAPIRADTVKDLIADPAAPDWSPAQKELLRQDGLFGGPDPLEKIPFDFRLLWTDGDGHEHNSKFIDWEVGQTWRSFRTRYSDPIAALRDAFMRRFSADRMALFYMGNFAQHPQHFGVCGTFCPRKVDYDEPTLPLF